METTVHKRKTYPREFKLMAVKMYLEKGMGYKSVAHELQIPDKSMVRRWVKNFKALGVDGLEERRGKTRTLFSGRPKTKELSLEQEVQKLRAENDFLKKLLLLQRG